MQNHIEPVYAVIIAHIHEDEVVGKRIRPCIESYWTDYSSAVEKVKFLREWNITEPIHIVLINQFGTNAKEIED